jgi:hypothetical protein
MKATIMPIEAFLMELPTMCLSRLRSRSQSKENG